MIEKQVTIEGVMRYEPEESNETAMLQNYRAEAVTKGATYTLIDALPYDFVVQNLFYRVTEAFDGTVSVGTDALPERILAAANFVKTVGKKSAAKSLHIEVGQPIRLFVGAGTTGKIEVHVTGFLLMPSLL